MAGAARFEKLNLPGPRSYLFALQEDSLSPLYSLLLSNILFLDKGDAGKHRKTSKNCP
jgi:hypothetical protein